MLRTRSEATHKKIRASGAPRPIRIALLIAVLLTVAFASSAVQAEGALRIGVIADLHAHDLDSPIEGKWMSNTESRLMEFVNAMNEWSADLVIQLGDFVNGWIVLGVDPGDPSRIPGILSWADGLLAGFHGPRLHVVGNHDVYNLDKEQFKERLGLESTYYSLDANGFHLVVLDVQFDDQNNDLAHTYTGVAGFVPDVELQWLAEDLAAIDLPTLVCVHQRIEDFVEEWGRAVIGNATQLQQVLANDGDVIAVFQGHAHANHYSLIDGIHYITFEALVDQGTPPSWAAITLDSTLRTINIEGVGDQESYTLVY